MLMNIWKHQLLKNHRELNKEHAALHRTAPGRSNRSRCRALPHCVCGPSWAPGSPWSLWRRSFLWSSSYWTSDSWTGNRPYCRTAAAPRLGTEEGVSRVSLGKRTRHTCLWEKLEFPLLVTITVFIQVNGEQVLTGSHSLPPHFSICWGHVFQDSNTELLSMMN